MILLSSVFGQNRADSSLAESLFGHRPLDPSPPPWTHPCKQTFILDPPLWTRILDPGPIHADILNTQTHSCRRILDPAPTQQVCTPWILHPPSRYVYPGSWTHPCRHTLDPTLWTHAPAHVLPVPTKPSRHVHVYDPGVLAQSAFASHRNLISTHSFTSAVKPRALQLVHGQCLSCIGITQRGLSSPLDDVFARSVQVNETPVCGRHTLDQVDSTHAPLPAPSPKKTTQA